MVAERTIDYELVMILSPEASEDESTAIVERATSFITENGGDLNEQENWGVRRLSYTISKFTEGNYVLARFGLDAANVAELDRRLRSSESVLRHLITKTTKLKE